MASGLCQLYPAVSISSATWKTSGKCTLSQFQTPESKISFPAPISRCQPGHTPSRGSRGTCCLFQLLVTAGIPRLVTASLQVLPLRSHHLLFIVHQSTLCLLLMDPFDDIQGPPRYAGPSHMSKPSLNHTYKYPFSYRVPFTGSMDQDMVSFGGHCSAYCVLCV